ncbi:MAG: thioesterase family protein [Thermoleophilaceae bacterium]|nr:thioesterase family protein [Thermoleophilaceae bacterium]
MPFDEDTGLAPLGDGSFEGRIDRRWYTPVGPLGGYVMAIVMRAMQIAVDDPERRPRTMTMSFLRKPEQGPVVVKPVVERAGRSLAFTSARLEQDGKLLGIAMASFSPAWPGPLLDDTPMPEGIEPPGPRDAPPSGAPRPDPPPFTERLSMQWRFGEKPFAGADKGLTGGWLGLREERQLDALTVLVLADAWFPAPWPRLTKLAAAPTIEMSVYFRAPLPQPDALLLGRFETNYVRDGFFEEDGRLWTPDGTLIAQSRQLGLLMGAEA